MKKLLDFGRKALFYVRVLSGYEERRIRSYRLELRTKLEQAQAKKEALRKIPEQAILAEVRRMVEEMQTLNRKLDETESAIQEYFKPFDKQAEVIMYTQLKAEEKNMREMVKIMHERALQEKIAQESMSKSCSEDAEQNKLDKSSASTG